MDAGALGGLCCCRRDQVLAIDDRVPQGGTPKSDWQRAVQAIPGTDLGEGAEKPIEAQWLRCYLTAGEVQCSQRLLDAI